jgi:hypothetical protein
MPRKRIPAGQMLTGYLTQAQQRRLARVVAGIVLDAALNGHEFTSVLHGDARSHAHWQRLNQDDCRAIKAEARAIAARMIGPAE